jgi:hypothetical protein
LSTTGRISSGLPLTRRPIGSLVKSPSSKIASKSTSESKATLTPSPNSVSMSSGSSRPVSRSASASISSTDSPPLNTPAIDSR